MIKKKDVILSAVCICLGAGIGFGTKSMLMEEKEQEPAVSEVQKQRNSTKDDSEEKTKLVAVSYTHLDVYKRQEVFCLNASLTAIQHPAIIHPLLPAAAHTGNYAVIVGEQRLCEHIIAPCCTILDRLNVRDTSIGKPVRITDRIHTDICLLYTSRCV